MGGAQQQAKFPRIFFNRNEFSLIGWTERNDLLTVWPWKSIFVERLKGISLEQKKDHFLCLHVKFHNVFRCSCSRELRRIYTKHIRTATEIYLLYSCGVGGVLRKQWEKKACTWFPCAPLGGCIRVCSSAHGMCVLGNGNKCLDHCVCLLTFTGYAWQQHSVRAHDTCVL